jgi:hypothetical protein
MVREISGTSDNRHNPQIKRVSVRSNGAGHATAGVVTAAATPTKPTFAIKDTVSIKSALASSEKR